MSEIADRLAAVRSRITNAARICGRNPDQITLLAVSKTKPTTAIQEAIAAGQRHFGENYLQEALAKIAAFADQDLVWHYIGRLQSNKTRLIAQHFDWVHSLADAKHANRLATQCPSELAKLNVCIQVNISDEASKGGILEAGLVDLAGVVADHPQLKLRGLMTMPDPTRPAAAQRAAFHRLRELAEQLRHTGFPLDTLSMGMSGDLEVAIKEGSTLVRVGTDIFGPRV